MSQGRRRSPLPAGWSSIRRAVLQRDPTCRLQLPRCTGASTQVHHLLAHDYHHPDGLAGVCVSCHATVTARDANAARGYPRRARPTQPHPGLAPPGG